VIIRPTPTPIEKKAWPIASRKVVKLTLSQSGLNRKEAVLPKSPVVMANRTTPTSMMKNRGIRILAAFSSPAFTPRPTMKTFAEMNMARRPRTPNVLEMVFSKLAPEAAASIPENRPPMACITNDSNQADITM